MSAANASDVLPRWLISEVLRSTAERPVLLVARIIVVVSSVFFIAAFEGAAIRSAVTEQQRLEDDGAHLVEVLADPSANESLRSADCDSLAAIQGVSDTGWWVDAGPTRLDRSPGVPISTYMVGAGLIRLGKLDLHHPGVFVGEAVVDEFGLRQVELISGQERPVSVIEPAAATQRFGRALLDVGAQAEFVDGCLVGRAGLSAAGVSDSIRSLVAEPSAIGAIRLVGPETSSLLREFEGRPSRWTVAAVAVATGVWFWVVDYFRRRDHALNRVLGFSSPAALLAEILSALLVLAIGIAIAVSLVVGTRGAAVEAEAAHFLLSIVQYAGIVVSLVGLSPTLIRPPDVLQQIRDE